MKNSFWVWLWNISGSDQRSAGNKHRKHPGSFPRLCLRGPSEVSTARRRPALKTPKRRPFAPNSHCGEKGRLWMTAGPSHSFTVQSLKKTKNPTATQPWAVATQLKYFIINVPIRAFFHSSTVDVSLCCLFSSSAWSKLCCGNVKFTAEYWRVIAAYESTKTNKMKCCGCFF